MPPTRGVYKGEAESELSVQVTVLPMDAPAEEMPRTTVIRSRSRSAELYADIEQRQQQQQQ